jgi:hypothetical protein
VVNGAALTTDRFGVANKAYSFNGSSSFINVPNSSSLQFNGALTVSAWMLPTALNSPVSYWFSKGADGGTPFSWTSSVVASTGAASVSIFNNSNQNCGTNSTSQVVLNQWVNVLCTFDGNFARTYFNGILESSIPCNYTTFSNIYELKFGRRHTSGLPYFWTGKLDDFGVWNRTLTQQEITNLYTNSVPPSITTSASPSLINCGETATLTASSTSTVQPCVKAELPATLQNGLVGYWPFCGNANDASGNNNNGTVNGATLTSDRFGNVNSAYNFNGGSNRIVITNSILTNTPSSYTISLWVLNSSTGPGELICDRSQSNYDYKYRLFFRNDLPGSPVSFNTISNTNLSGILGGDFSTSTWRHITAVGNSSNNTTILYIDGQAIGNSGFYYPFELNSTTFGANFAPSGFDQSINGKLDDIAIYNRALSPSEIQQLYNLGNVSYSWSTGATTPSITVTPAQTSTYTCTATNSSGSTTSSVSVTVADTLTWTGAVDTDWHKPCNWSPQFVPKCCNNVSVPLSTNQPIVSGIAAAEDITIFSTNGAQLTVNNGANLQIATCPTAITTTACPSLSVITTTAVSSITQTTAVSGGTISYQGASAITARGVCWGTSPNPTIANSLTSNGIGIGTFTSNLTGLVVGTTYYVRAYATNGSGTSYGNQLSFVAVNPQPAYPVNSVFCASGPTLVVDVTSPTGKIWMDRNLGASQVATSSTDASSYGDLYQWGRRSDGHQCRTSTTTITLSSSDQPGHGNFILAANTPFDWRSPQNSNLWQGVNGVNNPCPIGYRVPTETELDAERLSWSQLSNIGAFNSVLKLPLAGSRSVSNGTFTLLNTDGFCRSSTLSGIDSRNLNYGTGYAIMSSNRRGGGITVRCIKN